jgi:hypothetical protein
MKGKKMDGLEKTLCIIFLIITFGTLASCYLSYQENKVAMENGYIQKADNRTMGGKLWVKSDDKAEKK